MEPFQHTLSDTLVEFSTLRVFGASERCQNRVRDRVGNKHKSPGEVPGDSRGSLLNQNGRGSWGSGLSPSIGASVSANQSLSCWARMMNPDERATPGIRIEGSYFAQGTSFKSVRADPEMPAGIRMPLSMSSGFMRSSWCIGSHAAGIWCRDPSHSACSWLRSRFARIKLWRASAAARTASRPRNRAADCRTVAAS